MRETMTDTTHKMLLPNRILIMARRFVADRSGAAAIGYGLMTLIAIAVVLAVSQVGDGVGAVFQKLQAAFAN
jgi:Flp pilus assembly pilin Flp